jgi:hypothetical protein
VPQVREIRSTASEGNAQIIVIFNFHMNMVEAADEIRNAISQVRHKLPLEMREPVLFRVDPSQEPVMQLALSSKTQTLAEISRLAEDQLADRFRGSVYSGDDPLLAGLVQQGQVSLSGYGIQRLPLLMRAIREHGQPVKPANYFKWSRTGVKQGELVFVPGNPGSTGRLQTVTELEFQRDVSFPVTLRRLESIITALQTYMKEGDEQFRVGNENLFGQQNSYKAISGFNRGLNDPKLMAKKRAAEADLRKRIAADDAQREKFGKLWDELATAYGGYRSYYTRYTLLEGGATRGTALLALARGIVRYAAETRKPNADRLREYVETALPAREQAMYSPAPITPSMEIAVLTEYFTFLSKELGASDPVVARILDGKSPRQAAEHYVNTSKIIDVAERKRLASDPAAVESSTDGMIRLALILDAPARELRKRYEDQVESVVTRAAAQIAQARYDLSGGTEYPDATFTLRVAFGPVKGYKNDKGQNVPWATTFSGLWPKGTGKDPYVIPPTWLKAKAKLNPNTPFNFVSTADTHGGNSGSATINAKGEVVGILFDGNIEGLPNRFVYTDDQARSVHVASQSVAEALKFVYEANNLLKELNLN